MAEINASAGNNRNRGGRRSKKLSTRVDMTPMVDLGFLLITFFILTTTWSKPHTTRLFLPADGTGTVTGQSATLTIVPIANNRIFYFHGDLTTALRDGAYGTVGYSLKDGIGDIIRQKQIAMDHSYKGGRNEMTLIIKPSADATYGNVVSLLDETLINQIKKYALVDLPKDEEQTISLKKL
ncbi:MAG TPA: biopolymer transporter ExbD [Puia sp.]